MAPARHIGFGTSGLRGPASGFTPALVGAYVAAFLETCCAGAARREVAIGADLRRSSPAIAGMVAGTVAEHGWRPVYGGAVPTPVLACYALGRGLPAIMVTGSHIPPDYNGLKFYRPDGELLKSDEAPIAAAARALMDKGEAADPVDLLPVEPAVADAYRARFSQGFSSQVLEGLHVGVFAHSAVGGDLMVEILERLGARCTVFGRSDAFIAVDTEAVEPAYMETMRAALRDHGLEAVVSSDGDGDRPLVLDERGAQINGDSLGALAARFLGAQTVVTPLTSTGAIEASGWFGTVIRTRIGSPYVVEAMAGAGSGVVGFEANGGFLQQSPLRIGGGELGPLPTRDAVLPIVATLAAARAAGLPLSALAATLPARVMKAARLTDVAPARGHDFVVTMAASAPARAALSPLLKTPRAIDTTDGARFTLEDGSVVHFRQSGNAPELRCYVETDAAAHTDRLLGVMMERLGQKFGQKGEDGYAGA